MEKDKGIFSFRKHPVGELLGGKKERKRKMHRALGMLLAAALIVGTLPASGLAVSASGREAGLCEHHSEHTAECGYKEAQPCTHEHGEECYRTVTECVHEHTDGCYPETEESTGEGSATDSDAESREPSKCTHECSEESGCITKLLDCHHEHDESCGYQEAQECGYVCEICNGKKSEDTENTEDADIDMAACICKVLCTEDSINGDCPVCGADDASLLDCKGKASEENKGEPEDTGICKHHQEHDADCGYIPKSEDGEGSPCTYECRICPVEDLIAALPDKITEDNGSDVRAQLEEILAFYRELSEDEQEQIDISRCLRLQEALNAGNVTAPAAEGTPDLELFGQKVCSGDSGDGWSYEAGVLTLEDFHADNSSEDFIHVTNVDLDFTLYVKGDNSVKTSGKLIWGSVYGSMTITGEQGASLSLDGKSWSDRYISIYGVTMNVTMQEMIFLAYDMEIDNATVSFNMSGASGYIYTTHGGFTVKNGSNVTITNSSGVADYCVATNKAEITDSTLEMINPSGFGVYVTKLSQQPSEYKASVTNSTISADVLDAAVHCEEEVSVANSQVTGSGRFLLRSKKAITVDGSTMEGITYEFFKSDTGAVYQVYGGHTLAANLTVAENGSFVIPEGAALTIPDGVTLENNGTMRIHDKTSLTGTGALAGSGEFLIDVNEDMISIPEGLTYTGKDYTDQITLESTTMICGVEFTADTEGWTRNIAPAVVKDAGEYTVTFTKEDKEISKTFTVAQSGTDLISEGKVLTYKGDTQTTTFSADDTITVKAAPTATGTAPQKAAARLRGEPGAGQMALYVGNTLVSSQAVDAGEDGTYTMEVSASDVLFAAGGPGTEIPLTARFTGNDNMADAAGTVKVNISAVARVEKGSTTSYVDKNGLNTVFAYNSGYEDATVTLLDDLTITEIANRPQINIPCTLNLNGHTIRSDAVGAPPLAVNVSGNVTITGSGEIVSSKDAALYIVGTAVLEGGIFCSSGAYHGAVEVINGNLSVTDENVVMKNTGNGNGLLIYSLASGAVRLSAGKYSGAEGAVKIYSGVTLAGLLNQAGDSRVAYYQDNTTLVTEGLDGQTLPSGSYTVKACTHDYKYTHTTGTTTHSQTCPACGDTKTSENCSYAEGKCACGSTLSVTLSGAEGLVYNGSSHTPGVTVTLDGTELTAAGYDVTYADNVNAGTDTATLTVTGKGSYSFEIKKTFSIEKAEQKDFAVTAVTKQYEKNGTFTLSTTGGGGDGAVLYRVPENNGVLMVNGNTAVIIGVGIVTVTAAKAESDNYKAATAIGHITIKKAPAPAITYPTAVSITYGQRLSDCALTGGSTEYGTFAWKEASTVPAVGDTTSYAAVFTASEETKKNYETITNTTQNVPVKVEKAVPAVSITAALSGSKDNRQAVLTVNVAKAGAGAFPTGTVKLIDCTDSTEKEIGTVTLNSSGTASYTWGGLLDQTYTIKAVYTGNSNYMETESRELTFDAAKQNQQDFALDAIGAKTYGDAAVILKTTGGSGSGAVRYESSDEDVIRIENGRAVITGAGTAVITAIKEEDDNYNEAFASRNVTVAKKALTVKADSKTVVRGNPMPVFTYRTNGLVNGDTFTTDPSITAGAQNTDTLGKYDIVISGGTLRNSESYSITYVNGTLNIVERFYTVTVTDGTGGGEYAEGDTVTVTANERNGYTFTGWSSEDGAAFADSKAKTTTFTMPARSVAVKANYTRNNSGGNNGGGSGNGGNSGGSGNNGGGNSGGNEDNGGSGGNDEGQGSGGNGSTNPGNGNTTPRPSVIPPIDTGAGTGNETAPGTGTTPAGPGSGNTSRQGTAPGSGSAGIPAQGLKQPFIKGADGKIGWDVIRAEEEQAQEGSIINVDMNGSTVVPGDIFDSIKGKDITVTFDMGSGILWSVNGKEVITDKAGDIDFSVKAETNAIPVDIVNNVTGERYSIQISLAYDGEFGFTAVLSIDLGRENAGYTASLYYYNESAGELEFICSDEIAEDGTVSLAFTHASDYVIAIDGDEESGSAAEPAQPEKQDGDSTIPAGENPQAVQAWRPWWIIVAGALVIIVGIGVFFVVKKKQEDENSGQ